MSLGCCGALEGKRTLFFHKADSIEPPTPVGRGIHDSIYVLVRNFAAMSKVAMNSTYSPTVDEATVATRNWLERAVIGLNLCPFAKGVSVKKQVRYVVSMAADTDTLLFELERELQYLKEVSPEETDTTLLIHPYVLRCFDDFTDFLDLVDVTVRMQGLAGTLQVANFHPDYCFSDAEPDDLGNYTNRAPYPTLHLIREESLDRAVRAFPEAAKIYERNIKTMERIGLAGWQALNVDTVKPGN